MSLYIHATADTIIKYPFSRADLSTTFPNVSFPPNPTAEDLAPFDVFPVATTPRPADTRDERAVEGDPMLTDSGWQQVWSTRPATEDEINAWDAAHAPQPQWVEFGIQLATSPLFSAVCDQLPSAIANGLSIGLNEASKGNARLFTGLWQKVLELNVITDDLLIEISKLAEQSHLPAPFITALAPQHQRARDAAGRFIPDDPATPENEAWTFTDQLAIASSAD